MSVQLPPPPPGIDLTANESWQNTASLAPTYALAMAAVILRCLGRKYSGAGFWIDDYLILLAAVIQTVVFGIGIRSRYNGAGQHVWAIGYDGQADYMKNVVLPVGLFYSPEIAIVKCSILAFYWRLFGITYLRKWIIFFAVCSIVWALAATIAECLQCFPLSKFWYVLEDGYCYSGKALYIGGAIPNICTDLILLIMPIQFIWRLQFPLHKRILLTGIFGCGFFVIAVSCYRVYVMWLYDGTSVDQSWVLLGTGVWTCLEMNLVLFAANLPTLGPLVHFILTGSWRAASLIIPQHARRAAEANAAAAGAGAGAGAGAVASPRAGAGGARRGVWSRAFGGLSILQTTVPGPEVEEIEGRSTDFEEIQTNSSSSAGGTLPMRDLEKGLKSATVTQTSKTDSSD